MKGSCDALADLQSVELSRQRSGRRAAILSRTIAVMRFISVLSAVLFKSAS